MLGPCSGDNQLADCPEESPQGDPSLAGRKAASRALGIGLTDSPLEGDGFELPVPRAMQARLEAKIAGVGCVRRRLSAAAVGGHQLRRKAKSRNRTVIARGTGSSNPSPSSGESLANPDFIATGPTVQLGFGCPGDVTAKIWPGRNSNTFTAYIARQVPELGL